jgi:hypothetical protein
MPGVAGALVGLAVGATVVGTGLVGDDVGAAAYPF